MTASAPFVSRSLAIRCGSCAKRYDPALATVCACASDHRTLLCPFCGSCSCSGRAADVRQHFATVPSSALRQMREQQELERRPGAAPAELRRPLVVVADDNFDIRAVVKRVLEQHGFGVVAVENGELAWETIRKLQPEIALLDGLMPKADGRVVAQHVKYDDSLRTKCVLMTSLYTSAAQKNEAFRLFGIDAHLSKPVAPELLVETLRGLLSESA